MQASTAQHGTGSNETLGDGMRDLALGVSSYSFAASIEAGRLTASDVVDRVADLGADHLEIADAGLGFDPLADPAAVRALRVRAEARGLPIANYAVAADFTGDPARIDVEVQRVRRQIDVAVALGSPRMRHDVVPWAWREADQAEVESLLARLIPVCRGLADYAADRGVTTMVENHGFFINPGERLRRLVAAVDHPHFRALLDVGNVLCVDEDPVVQTERTLPMASVVHLKDFRVRRSDSGLGPTPDGWLTTLGGAAILGTVVGYGELPIRRLLALVAASGFDGPVSIEFEGLEDDSWAVERGLDVVRGMWEEIGR